MTRLVLSIEHGPENYLRNIALRIFARSETKAEAKRKLQDVINGAGLTDAERDEFLAWFSTFVILQYHALNNPSVKRDPS